ncbi:hypothetical protein [Desulfonema magnum]|uniref:Uncharacterized protein n=1 Tax=Desulfonema magnum TaxID=45655 RepID=A0A975BQ79_9BACT|nr:hypothetical protein [Desulfonema magnum]QTA89555.1 Uncharacterized protein dnm_056110 [Desulfonema magnum]
MEKTRQKKTLLHDDGKTYYTKATERKVFFVMTLIMLVWGILSKLGLL